LGVAKRETRLTITFIRRTSTMKKSELIAAMAESADISNVAAGNALNGMLDAVSGALAKGDKVSLIGFGTFSVTKRAARDGRNPQTGETIKIAAKKVAKFKVGARLADAVN
jgi:DNA-binding protein HU-beta